MVFRMIHCIKCAIQYERKFEILSRDEICTLRKISAQEEGFFGDTIFCLIITSQNIGS